MAKNKMDKAVYAEVGFDVQTGEIFNHRTIYKTADEPEFVKLYLDCLLTLKGLGKGLNPILLAFLQYMSYADINGFGGGQVIFVNKMMKQTIADKLGVTIKRVDQAITEFVKSGIFKRIAVGTYQVNANIIGKGEWKDIKNIRATFDFANKEVVAEVVNYEENEVNITTDRLENEYSDNLKECC